MTEESLEITLEEKLNLIADLKLRYNAEKNRFDRETADLQEALKSLEDEVKFEVYRIGESVNTDYITAVYSKGRETWDTKRLEKYAKSHPEILQMKKVGEPSISFRLKG